MKRFASLLTAAALTLALTGCWGSKSDSMSNPNPTPLPSASAPGTVPGQTAPGSAGSHRTEDSSSASGHASAPTDPHSDADSHRMPDSSRASDHDKSHSGTGSKAAAANAAAPAEGPWSLVLVNAEHPLPADFTVETKAIPGYDHRMFDSRAADALQDLLKAAQADGKPLYLVSAYRSVSRQEALFLRKVNFYKAQGLDTAKAEQAAAKVVARPGTSEHNLGLAADIVSADWYQQHSDLTADFDGTPEAQWLRQNAARFGFVLRYPRDKQVVTGVEWEPWHYRYVGPSAAAAMEKSGECLEEYLAHHA